MKRLGKRYASMIEDYASLLDELERNPRLGTDLGGGVRKIRMAIKSKHRGKSHGARVITYTYTIDEKKKIINLIFIYDKEERDNISPKEITALIKEIELLK